jgi:hypothetical protein
MRNSFALNLVLNLQDAVPGWSQVKLESLGENSYHLRGVCEKTPGVLLQLVRTLELLAGLDVLHASHVCCEDVIISNMVIEVLVHITHPVYPSRA